MAKKLKEARAEILQWTEDQILASPENLAKNLLARLRTIEEAMPPYYTLPPLQGNARLILAGYLDCGGLFRTTKTIRAGRDAAESGTPLKLNLLADWHEDINGLRDKTSRAVQEWLVGTVRARKSLLTFVEGWSKPLTWQDYHEDTRDQSGSIVPKTLEEFRTWASQDRGNGFKWWEKLLDLVGIPLVGCESAEGHYAHMVVRGVRFANKDLDNFQSETWCILSFWLRDQVILANIALEMRRRGLTEADLVIGCYHGVTMPRVCQAWGINLEIILPPGQELPKPIKFL